MKINTFASIKNFIFIHRDQMHAEGWCFISDNGVLAIGKYGDEFETNQDACDYVLNCSTSEQLYISAAEIHNRNILYETFAADPFLQYQNKDCLTLFVNDENPPCESVPLNIYSYGGEDKLRFYRLHKDYYEQEGVVKHSVYRWYQVEVKSECQSAFKMICDSQEGIESFLH